MRFCSILHCTVGTVRDCLRLNHLAEQRLAARRLSDEHSHKCSAQKCTDVLRSATRRSNEANRLQHLVLQMIMLGSLSILALSTVIQSAEATSRGCNDAMYIRLCIHIYVYLVQQSQSFTGTQQTYYTHITLFIYRPYSRHNGVLTSSSSARVPDLGVARMPSVFGVEHLRGVEHFCCLFGL